MWNDLNPQPKHVLTTVDSALQILQMIRDEGSVRVKDAAARLEISPAAAHRLLQMLTYRGFAHQDEARIYRAGLGLNVPPINAGTIPRFRIASRSLFETFVAEIACTASLVARFGTTVRFIETYVPQSSVAILSRRGQILPAERTSGGKALLSRLPDDTIVRLYRSHGAALSGNALGPGNFRRLLYELKDVRDRGYATNHEETEPGVSALGMAIRQADSHSNLAFAVAVPSERADMFTQPSFLAACEVFRQRLGDFG